MYSAKPLNVPQDFFARAPRLQCVARSPAGTGQKGGKKEEGAWLCHQTTRELNASDKEARNLLPWRLLFLLGLARPSCLQLRGHCYWHTLKCRSSTLRPLPLGQPLRAGPTRTSKLRILRRTLFRLSRGPLKPTTLRQAAGITMCVVEASYSLNASHAHVRYAFMKSARAASPRGRPCSRAMAPC